MNGNFFNEFTKKSTCDNSLGMTILCSTAKSLLPPQLIVRLLIFTASMFSEATSFQVYLGPVERGMGVEQVTILQIVLFFLRVSHFS